MRLFIKILTFTILLVVTSNSCKDDYKHPVPDVYVDLLVNINTHYELQNINGFIYKNDYGFNGIVIFRYSLNEFMAFDRACPHHPYEYDCRIEVKEPPLAIDECCGSRYLMLDGSVVDGPSKHPLKQYRTFFDAERNYLQVTN